MLLTEKEQTAFKTWLLPKLEAISDAEAEVLADYVAALITVDEPDASVRRNCIESLQDFLGNDNTEPFVNDVFAALRDRTYLPPPPAAPIQSIVSSANLDYEPYYPNAPLNAPKGPAATRRPTATHRLSDRATAPGMLPDELNQSRKRRFMDRGDSQPRDTQDPHYSRSGGVNDRPLKQTARRGGRNAGPGDMRQSGLSDVNSMPPQGPSSFDISNPVVVMAMAAAFGVNLASTSSSLSNGQGNNSGQKILMPPCPSYYEKGLCAFGSFCPFEHSDDAIAVPSHEVPAYDPEHSYLAAPPDLLTRNHAVSHSHRHATKRGKPRAPSSDPSNTALVVKQIPSEHLDEESVRNYFSEFGSILDVDVHTDKRLAIITFSDHSAARQAYKSPKAIFDNRFVRVYWHRPQEHQEEEKLDLEAIALRQAAAQQAFEERRRKEEDAAARAAEIERRLKEQNEEMQEIKRQLAELSGDKTDMFEQDLITLQAQAAEMFGRHDPIDHSVRDRGRGAFRGAYRGRGFTAPRGGYGGRGSAPFASTFDGHCAVKRLDNRPRRLAVAGIEADTPKDEALRQYLLNFPGCTAIEPHPEQADTLILTFKERYQAEMFIDKSPHIPDVGKLDLAWVPNDAFSSIKPSTTTTNEESASITYGNSANAEDGDDSPATVGEADGKAEEDGGQLVGGPDADMDVAEDGDQWR